MNQNMMQQMAMMMAMMNGMNNNNANAISAEDDAINSSYSTESIILRRATRKSGAQAGQQVKYIVINMSDDYSFSSTTQTIRIFDKEPMWDILAKYPAVGSNPADPTKDIVVDLVALQQSPDFVGKLAKIMHFKGMTTVEYKLRKGMCYQNDATGKRMTNKQGQPILRDRIRVFCQIARYAINEETGQREARYVDGFDPQSQGAHIENTFYLEPANVVVNDEPTTDQLVLNAQSTVPTAPVAPVAPPAPQPAPTAAPQVPPAAPQA